VRFSRRIGSDFKQKSSLFKNPLLTCLKMMKTENPMPSRLMIITGIYVSRVVSIFVLGNTFFHTIVYPFLE